MLQLNNLRKQYGSHLAVDGVSFEVTRGESFGLLGPNGAGKTTTISMIVGLLKPDAGTVLIDGRLDPSQPDARKLIGFAPQTLSLYENLTAHENLTFFAKLYGDSKSIRRARVDWALDFAGLTERRKDRVKTFSGGMQRRLNLAVALVHDPQLILLDEPTVGVDPQSRNHLLETVEQLKQEGRTIIYTTHDMGEAQRLCDRVAIMDHGQLLDVDTVDGLINKHGGRSVVNAELKQVPDDPSLLPAALDGLSLRFESDNPLEEIGRLSTAGMTFQTLEVARPDLETVFLTLTGRSLRD